MMKPDIFDRVADKRGSREQNAGILPSGMLSNLSHSISDAHESRLTAMHYPRFWVDWIERIEQKGYDENASLKAEHDFEWGLDHLGLSISRNQPRQELLAFAQNALSNSEEHFIPKHISAAQFLLQGHTLTFPSPIPSFDSNNNLVRCFYTPINNNLNGIVIVVPHWNAEGPRCARLCGLMARMGFPTLRMTLPYHDLRGTPERGINSTAMVSANIGLTLHAMRQAVQELIASITWLKAIGYQKIVVMGESIGACVSFLASAHDSRIHGLFANLLASSFGEAVWTGLATQHIYKSIVGHLSLDDLKAVWLPNSPLPFTHKLKLTNAPLHLTICSGRFDTTFRYHLTQELFSSLDRHFGRFGRVILPCGHYSMGKFPFRYIVGLQMYLFIKRIFIAPLQD